MMARGHALSGALLCGAVGPALPHTGPPNTLTEVGAAGVLGALFALVPDLDSRRSRIRKMLPLLGPLLSWLLIGLARWTYQATRTDQDKPESDGHRGLCHTPVWQALVGLLAGAGLSRTPAAGWALFVGVVVFLGQLAHSLGDCLTRAGVPMWWPIICGGQRWRRVGAPAWLRFSTGGKRGRWLGVAETRWWDVAGEKVTTGLLAAGCVALGFAVAAGLYPPWGQ